jgi:hypothetical protein
VTDGGGEGEEVADMEVVRVAVDVEAEFAFEYLERDGSVGVVLLHPGGLLHGDENDSEVVLFKEGFGVVARGPGFFLFGVGYLLEQIELRLFVDHGAVLLGGGHCSSLIANYFDAGMLGGGYGGDSEVRGSMERAFGGR